jgi:hypothetical protein
MPTSRSNKITLAVSWPCVNPTRASTRVRMPAAVVVIIVLVQQLLDRTDLATVLIG